MIELDLDGALATAWEWAWVRHGNVLSWYIRPLVPGPVGPRRLPPQRARHRALRAGLAEQHGVVPGPTVPDPRVQEFLAFEQEWLLGGWSAAKVAISVVVPLSLAAYCAAFWQRSLRWGLAVLAFMALGKIGWSVAFGGSSGGATDIPARAGLGAGGAILAFALRHRRRPRGPRSAAVW